MKKVFIAILLLSIITSQAQSKDDLSSAFASSIQQKKYNQLQKFIPTAAQLKQISPKEFTEANVKQFMASLKASWDKLISVAATKKVSLQSVKVIETIAKDMEHTKKMSFLIIHYSFNEKQEGITELVVTKFNNKLYLLNIPNPTMMFISKEPQKIKEELSIVKGASDIKIQPHFDSLKTFVNTNDVNAFVKKCVYRGNDENRKWKETINTNNTDEVAAATSYYYKAKEIFNSCTHIVTGTLKLEKESEGLWHVYTFTCNDKNVHFAFLKINDNYYLGDIDKD